MRIKLIGSFLILIGCMLYVTACSDNVSPGLEESLELYTGLEAIPEASNTTLAINKGSDAAKDGYFQIQISDAQPNELIKNIQTEAWCLEWKKPLRTNNDTHTGVKWYTSKTNDKWKPINYFFSIRNDLHKEYEDLTYREIQAVIWTLAGYMKIAPEFNIDKLSDSELPSRLRSNGVANFDKAKVRDISSRVLSNYSEAEVVRYGIVGQTQEDEQDIIIPDPDDEVVRVELTPEEGEVKVSETIQLTATFFDTDDNEVSCDDPQWSSDNESVATVDSNGEVFGESQGSANIMVECDGATDSSAITVIREDISVPGRDIVVFNDVEPFDQSRLQNPNNVTFVKNLINFTTTGPRNSGDTVMWDCGRNTRFNGCTSSRHQNGSKALIEDEGFTYTAINSASGTLVDIPANVKSLWLWLPTVPYTVDEINALKQFAAEGGRIVFIGEWDGFYGTTGLAVENQLLRNLGALMRNVGNAVDCGNVTLPPASIREHPITDGVTDLTIGCASVIELGPNDFPLFYDTTNTLVLGGVAKIDTVPITALEKRVAKQPLMIQENSLLKNTSTTGYK